MKGNTVRRNAKRLVKSVIKVPKELIKLQQDVELAIDFCHRYFCPLIIGRIVHNHHSRASIQGLLIVFLSTNTFSLPSTTLKYASQW
jgi:hypothetical protein